MRIVKAQVTPISQVDGKEALRVIQRCAKTCYKSYKDTDDEESAKRIVRNLIASGHTSLLENYIITMNFLSNIAAYKDLTRSRVGVSYSIESTRWCVAGNTKLKFKSKYNNFTIEELYRKSINSSNGSWKRMRIAQVDENTGFVVYNTIKNIFFTGEKETFRVKTKLGYELTCTADHKIYTPNGYMKLKDLSIGNKVYVNGQEIQKPLYQNYDWLYHQNITLNKTFVQIAKEFGFNVSTLKDWKRKLKLPSKGTGYFNIGRIPWNKGVNENQDERVKKQANALREFHYDRWHDVGNIKKENTTKYGKHNKGFCEICNSKTLLDVHHIDKNRENNNPSNLMTLCKVCHSRVHKQSLLCIYADEIISIENVGVQKVYDLEMNGEWHNFNANGIIVHNCNYSKGKFGNQISFLDPIEIPNKDSKEYITWLKAMQSVEDYYISMASNGATPDQLSLILPQSTAAEFNITGNLRAWKNMFDLRVLDKTGHARPCIHEILEPTLELFHDKIPVVFDDQYELLQQKRLEKIYAEEQKKQLKIQFDSNEKTKGV